MQLVDFPFAWICGIVAVCNAAAPASKDRDAPAAAKGGLLTGPIPPRPDITVGPKAPYRPLPLASPPRTKICNVVALGEGQDDGPNILKAFQECNGGGTVVLLKDQTYTIGTALFLTFNHVDWVIAGNIVFTDDVKYWQKAAFKQDFQNVVSFFQLGGTDINVYGGGTIDGQGQAWWDLYASNPLIERPSLFTVKDLHGATISNLNFRNSPQFYNVVSGSSDIVYSDINIEGASTSKNEAKNLDGWDTFHSENIVIQNSIINNGDDCVAFKAQSVGILVQSLECTGSHGISVGSLGQTKGETDIVEDIYVYNITMRDATNGARIKEWTGGQSALSEDLQGGGGSGSVRNITWDTMNLINVEWAAQITQCYGQKDLHLCTATPSKVTNSEILFKDFTGTTTGEKDPLVGRLICASPGACTNIEFVNFEVKTPKGADIFECLNMEQNPKLGVTCRPPKQKKVDTSNKTDPNKETDSSSMTVKDSKTETISESGSGTGTGKGTG